MRPECNEELDGTAESQTFDCLPGNPLQFGLKPLFAITALVGVVLTLVVGNPLFFVVVVVVAFVAMLQSLRTDPF